MGRRLMMAVTTVAVAVGAWAATETVGGYTWTYRINGDTAEINNEFFEEPKDDFRIFITAARYKSSDKSYQGMKQALSSFSCVDIPRNFPRVSRARKNGAAKLIREDDLFVYLQMVIQTGKRLDFSFAKKIV